MRAAEQFLLTDQQPPDKAKVIQKAAEISSDLEKLSSDIPEAVKEKLKSQLAQLRQDITDYPLLPNASDLTRRADEIEKLVDDNPDQARQRLNQLRAELVQQLAQRLDKELDGPGFGLPPGFEQSTWDKLKKSTEAMLQDAQKASDPDKAIGLYREAVSELIAQLVKAFQAVIQREVGKLTALPQPSEEDKQKLNRLQQLGTDLNAVLTASSAGQYRTAFQAYTDARPKWVALTRDPASKDVQALGLEPARAILPGRITFSEIAQETPTTAPARRWVSLASAQAQVFVALLAGDVARLMIVMLASVFLGITVLWINSPTWGGWMARLTAVLWGLGLHQISGAAFEGVTGLQKKLSGES